MAPPSDGNTLVQAVILLAAAVIAAPIFKKLGLGSVLGYLCAGLVIGPFGLKLFSNPQSILHVAELGVVMFLFLIGIEMQPSRLWRMRKDIFGLGALQVTLCGSLLTGAGLLVGFTPAVAFIGGMGFVLSSTAMVMQILEERGEATTTRGQRTISTLLLEDLSIVPLLGLIAFLAPASGSNGFDWGGIALAVICLAGLIGVGLWLLNPFFALLANANAREVMTAAALLVVLGAALVMELGGLSAAMGAFMAGVLLSESSFRRQLEVDIEPFRGILLGLFFMAVGMSLDLKVVAESWRLIALIVMASMFVKGCGVYLAARLFGVARREAFYRAALLAQGGDFAFVLYAAAAKAGLFDARLTATLSAVIILSMVLTPFVVMVRQRLFNRTLKPLLEGVEEPDNLTGQVLMIGFGRFGQIVSQALLARNFDLSIIESDAKRIRSAADFGFKVYYGDGTRLDVLRASGAAEATLILVCVSGIETANRIVEIAKAEFPAAKIFARSYDRGHTLALLKAGVDYQIRETFESAMQFGEAALIGLGVAPEEAATLLAETRKSDAERLALQMTAGFHAGRELMRGNMPIPTPLIKPKRAGQIFDESATGPAPENSTTEAAQ